VRALHTVLRRSRGTGHRALCYGCLALGCTSPAYAQRWDIDPSIQAQATLTNNANYEQSAQREGDLVFNVLPAVGFQREGPRLRVAGSASLNMIGYANGAQTSRVLPQANVLANLEAIDQLFYVDAALRANQSLINPFLPRSDTASTFNKYTYVQGSVAPYLQGNFATNWRYLVRSDNSYTYTTQGDADLDNAYHGRHRAEVARIATPLGGLLRVQRDVTSFDDVRNVDQELDVALATINYAFTPLFSAGLRGGYERTNYTRTEESGPIYGAELEWRPSVRTRVGGFWEHRFFGPSYQFGASTRLRRFATNLSASRYVTTYPQQILELPATGNVSGLLDAILTARFPDPVERAQQVQDLIERQALPSSLPVGVNIFSRNANVLESASGTFALIGVRNTLALNLYYLKTKTLPDAAIPPSFITLTDNVQKGVTLSLSHRLTPVTSLNATASRWETRGLDRTAALITDENVFRVQVSRQLTPRSSAFVGARYRQQDSTSSGIGNTSEAAVFVGLFHQL